MKLSRAKVSIYENEKDQSTTSPSARAFDYESNVAKNILVPPINQESVLGSETKPRENNNITGTHAASVPIPVPSVEHDLVPPPGLFSR